MIELIFFPLHRVPQQCPLIGLWRVGDIDLGVLYLPKSPLNPLHIVWQSTLNLLVQPFGCGRVWFAECESLFSQFVVCPEHRFLRVRKT